MGQDSLRTLGCSAGPAGPALPSVVSRGHSHNALPRWNCPILLAGAAGPEESFHRLYVQEQLLSAGARL